MREEGKQSGFGLTLDDDAIAFKCFFKNILYFDWIWRGT